MSKPSFDIIPMASVHPDRINVYSEVNWSPYRPKRPKIDHLLKSDRKTHGIVSDQARRKMTKAAEYLIYMARDKQLPNTKHGKNYSFKICFVTLTLSSSQIHTDNEIKAIFLNQFLVEARKKWKVSRYVWRAERQVNGNLHFHILFDRFIPWSELRDCWNRIQNKLGYVDRYRDQMRAFHTGGFKVRNELLKSWDYKSQVKAYKAGKANDWNSPNSTDVHSIRRVSNIVAYIAKYMTKSKDEQSQDGRLWGCSVELSHIKGGQLVIDTNIQNELGKIRKNKDVKCYFGEYFTSFFVNSRQLQEMGCTSLYECFAGYLLNNFGFSDQPILNPDSS